MTSYDAWVTGQHENWQDRPDCEECGDSGCDKCEGEEMEEPGYTTVEINLIVDGTVHEPIDEIEVDLDNHGNISDKDLHDIAVGYLRSNEDASCVEIYCDGIVIYKLTHE